MTSAVVPLNPCPMCGAPSSPLEIEWKGDVLATVRCCRACAARIVAELARVRPIFDAMIKAGVERGLANDTMTFLLERYAFPEPTANDNPLVLCMLRWWVNGWRTLLRLMGRARG